MKQLRVLSLDGGGAKGFYTLGVLAEIEAMTGKPLHQCFDMIFGTSTGSIIAALLARGETVSEVKALYEKHVPSIMKQGTAKARSRALRSLAGQVFGEANFDVFKTRVGIVATNWADERPIIFKTSMDQAHGSKGSFQPGHGCTVADAVISSCSAYPFFERPTITKGNGDVVEVADGGFCANNPTLYALADALKLVGGQRDLIRVVSVGVGSYPEPPILRRAPKLLFTFGLFKLITSQAFLQKILGTNTCSMETLRNILFSDIPTIRISDTFNEPAMATDLLEHDLTKLNRLVQKGRLSFASHETVLRGFLIQADANTQPPPTSS